MNPSRETFLARVRQAVAEGNRAGDAAPLPERGTLGYQGAGPDPVERFCGELTAAGGHPHRVADRAAAVRQVLELVRDSTARRILLGHGRFVDSLNLQDRLHDLDV